MIINELKYPWLAVAAISGVSHQQHPPNTTTPIVQEEFPSRLDGWSLEGKETIKNARTELLEHGAVAFPNFLTQDAVSKAVAEMRSKEDNAFTTNTKHTAYLKHLDTTNYAINSIYNHPTKTIVASTAYDELAEDSVLKELYEDPRLLNMVASIVLGDDPQQELYLSEDPLGCCSVNVFRPDYYHGFHYDESEFSVTLMLQEAEGGGLFQYTDPIRHKIDGNNESDDDLTLELKRTADIFRDHEHDLGASSENTTSNKTFAEHEALEKENATSISNDDEKEDTAAAPRLHTLEFSPGTLLVLAGSKSLHRVTAIQGNQSRFVAVLTFASRPGFCNTPEVQEMFWGRTASIKPKMEIECEAST